MPAFVEEKFLAFRLGKRALVGRRTRYRKVIMRCRLCLFHALTLAIAPLNTCELS